MIRYLTMIVFVGVLFVSCQEELSQLIVQTKVAEPKLIDTTIVVTDTLNYSFGYFGDEEGVSIVSGPRNSLVCEFLNKQWEERVLQYIPKNDFLGIDSVAVVTLRGSDGAGPSINIDTTFIVIRVVKDDFHKKLIGKWNWISTCGGFTGACGYASQNNHRQIEFDNNMWFTEKLNDSILCHLPYHLINIHISAQDSVYEIGIGDQIGRNAYFSLNGDNLSRLFGDAGSQYERIK